MNDLIIKQYKNFYYIDFKPNVICEFHANNSCFEIVNYFDFDITEFRKFRTEHNFVSVLNFKTIDIALKVLDDLNQFIVFDKLLNKPCSNLKHTFFFKDYYTHPEKENIEKFMQTHKKTIADMAYNNPLYDFFTLFYALYKKENKTASGVVEKIIIEAMLNQGYDYDNYQFWQSNSYVDN